LRYVRLSVSERLFSVAYCCRRMSRAVRPDRGGRPDADLHHLRRAVFEPLAGWAVPGTIHPPPHGAGSIAQRLARANPNGFEINLLGRRMKVIPVGL
jgi:hypothetical protein